MNGSIQCRLRAGGVAALVLLGFTVPGIASGQTWSGAGGDSNWSTPGNWVGGVAPASGNATIVNFVTAASGFVSTVDAPFTLNRLNLLGTAAYTLGGAAISFDGVAPQLTLGGPYALANDLSFLVTTLIDAQTSQVLTGQVAGPAGLTKAGTGRLTLAGSPLTWGGSTTVSAGTLQIGNGTTGPNFFASPIVVDGEIDFAGTVPGTNVANSLSGTGTVTVSGGTMTGSGPAWTHSGATNITGGTLSATINSPGRLTVTGTGVLQTGDSAFGSLSDGAIPGTGSVFSNATAITVGSDNTSTTFSGTLAGAGGLTKVGTGRLTLASSPLTWGGSTTVSAGTLQIGNG
ncbi:MAG: autotransporter-associated beta strand repeat-containing protein, partial [Betaproteobacteria bacterium]|nr:autotransporter-associated beta strand repeat-containing protein [Betaproteobacteria bacterium]